MDTISLTKARTVTLAILLSIIRQTAAYSTGAPTRACADITPGHGYPVRTDPAPYLVEVSKTQYAPNERIYVRIRACGQARFRGFIIQPRSAVYPERPAFLGAFLRVQGTRYECVRSGAVLTHSNAEEKQSVTMTWIAPPAAAGHVVFRASENGTCADIEKVVSTVYTIYLQLELHNERRLADICVDDVKYDVACDECHCPACSYQIVSVVQDRSNYWVGINSPVVYDGVSRDLTMMQAFILQSPTDSSCLPGRQSASSTTEVAPQTTTEDIIPETTTVIEPTTTRAPRPTTTTARPTTTRVETTITPRTTAAPTRAPTTTFAVPTEMFYDYVWETSTSRPEPTTQRPTTTTAITTTTTTTTQMPTTTSEVIRPTTTEYVPVSPVITTTAVPDLITTTVNIETTPTIETTTQIVTEPPTTTTVKTTERTTTTTTTQPSTTTTTQSRKTTTSEQKLTTTEQEIITEAETTTTKRPTTISVSTMTQPAMTTTTSGAPTTMFVATTIREFPNPTSTTWQPAPTTTTLRKEMSTTMPESSTATPRLPELVSGSAGDTLREQFKRVELGSTTTKTSSDNGVQESAFFPDYYDQSQLNTINPNYYDFGIFNNQDPSILDSQPAVNTEKTQTPLFSSTSTKRGPSTTVWVPTRDWRMSTQFPTSTDISTKTPIIFRPPSTQVLTRSRIPESTTTQAVPTTIVVTEPTQRAAETIRLPEINLTPDQACGVTQGCLDDCKNGVCSFIVSWVAERTNTVFEIRTKPQISGQYWAAIGFSDDKMMGLDSVTECITEGEKINVYQSYNLDYYRNMRLLTPNLGIVDQSGSFRDGIFHCKFTRNNFVAGEKDVFDLNKNWYMMFAEGPAVNGIKIPHRYDMVPPVSRDRIDLQQYPPVHETYDYRQARKETVKVVNVTEITVQPSIGRRIAVDKECGSSRSCFQDCAPSGCHFIVSWSSHDDYVTFRMRAEVNDTKDVWIAIAFSDDKLMGDDSVVQCVANGEGKVDVRQSFNNGKNNVRLEQSDIGLSNISTSLADGVFECEFVRQRYIGDYDYIFNLDRRWNILFAHGKSKKGIMLPHSLEHRPHVSDSAVDFRKSAPSHITASTFFIKIHASVMIFAWILCASVASVVGRYFQPYWWGEKMLGSKVWIKVHWLFVLVTCSAVIAGFTVIFVGVNGISKLYEHPETGFNGTHPIMGLIVTLLALLNPLLLCLKPSEDSSGRAFFNCLYWLVEIGAHVLAVVTIYAGFGLTSDLIPHFFTYMLIGFTVYQILILLFMEALKSFDAKKTIEKKKVYLYEMQIRPWHARKNNSLAAYMDLNHTSKGLKQTAFATHLILLSALTTTMLVLIITGYH